MSADLADSSNSSDSADLTDSVSLASDETDSNLVFRPQDIDYFNLNSNIESVEVKENY